MQRNMTKGNATWKKPVRQHGKSTATWKKHRNMEKAPQHGKSTATQASTVKTTQHKKQGNARKRPKTKDRKQD
jgi:hypothetical protein